MAEVRVAVVDDHPLLRDAMAQVLAADPALPDLSIIQVSALQKLRDRLDNGLDVDLVMLELGIPGVGGLLGLVAFRYAFPTVPVIAMSEDDDGILQERCAAAGAAGFIAKSASAQQIRETVRAALAGEGWLPTHASERRARRLPA